MKINENILRDLIRQEIREVTKSTAKKSVAGKKLNPNTDPYAGPPRPKAKKGKFKKDDPNVNANMNDCFAAGQCWDGSGCWPCIPHGEIA